MTDRKAMQQAIKAMEYADACLNKQLTTKTKHEYAQDLLMEAGTVLRERLAQPKQEPDAYGYASRLAVAIWEQHYKATAPQWKPFDDLMGVLTQIDNMTAGLTSQRQPQYNKTEMNCFVQNLYDQKMREGKHGHYETMFHVVHRAIEAAHGIKENT